MTTYTTSLLKTTAVALVFVSAFIALQATSQQSVSATQPPPAPPASVQMAQNIAKINLRVTEIGTDYVDIAWDNVDGLSNRYNIEMTRTIAGRVFNADLSREMSADPCWNCLAYVNSYGLVDIITLTSTNNSTYRITGLQPGVLYRIILSQRGTIGVTEFERTAINNADISVAVQTRGVKSAEQTNLEQAVRQPGTQATTTPVPTAIGLQDGALIRGYGEQDVYIYKDTVVGVNQYRTRYARLILNPQVFNSYGHLSWDNIQAITPPMQDFFLENSIFVSNFVRQVDGDGKVYMLFPSGDVGVKRHIQLTAQQFESVSDAFYGSTSRPASDIWGAIYNTNDVELNIYSTGAPITTVQELRALLSN